MLVPLKKRTDAIRRLFFFGAGDEARTRYLHLGKVALYQMSYTRINKMHYTKVSPNVKHYFCFFYFLFYRHTASRIGGIIPYITSHLRIGILRKSRECKHIHMVVHSILADHIPKPRLSLPSAGNHLAIQLGATAHSCVNYGECLAIANTMAQQAIGWCKRGLLLIIVAFH